MSMIQCGDENMNTFGELPLLNKKAPDFFACNMNLEDVTLSEAYQNEPVLINVFPSIDTSVCFSSITNFQEKLVGSEVKIICISMDTPFALQRSSKSLSLDKVTLLSDMRNRSFGGAYGVVIADGPLAGFLARSVFLLDKSHNIIHKELVADISKAPNYDGILELIG